MEQKIKRLSVELSDDLHHKIKTFALRRNITIRKYVIRAIVHMIEREEKYNEEPKGEV